MSICTLKKDGYWCTLPVNHHSLHYDSFEKQWFDEFWRHASGWHYPPDGTDGHAIIECRSRHCGLSPEDL